MTPQPARAAGASGGKSKNAGNVRDRRKKRSNNGGAQWWRKLSLPRRGRKITKLTPSPRMTECDESILERRRKELLEALLVPRTARLKNVATASWDVRSGMATVDGPKGSLLHSMGLIKDGLHKLFPEEALFLVDRGCLQLSYNLLPMSLQRTWAMTFASRHALSVDKYLVYAYLRRTGLVVRRYDTYDTCDSTSSLNDSGTTTSPDFSVWRSGAFVRRDADEATGRIAFVLKVSSSLTDVPPTLASLSKWTSTNAGLHPRARCRVAVVERGIVMFADVASNATPLSSRFVKRRGKRDMQTCRALEDGDVSSWLPASTVAKLTAAGVAVDSSSTALRAVGRDGWPSGPQEKGAGEGAS